MTDNTIVVNKRILGVGATIEIRQIESSRARMSSNSGKATKILALTGMSSLEDKQRAFEAGVDG
jgi:CheY-like chemotaxis protein